MDIKAGEVWFVNFPYEEVSNKFSKRPAVVLNVETLEVLSVKVTKHNPRECDKFDTPIVYWEHARLHYKSTARVAKAVHIPKKQFIHKIGDLCQDDFETIIEEFVKFIKSQS
jgi:pimeloyl-CoA synthetase